MSHPAHRNPTRFDMGPQSKMWRVAIALALLSAIMYGVSDYVGGRTSRRLPPVAVALAAEAIMLPVFVVVVPLTERSAPSASAVWWGLTAGLTGSAGVLGMYMALARGNMTLVAPVTGVVAAAVPVAVGVSLGERPSALAWAGVAVAVVAVALVGGVLGLVGRSRSQPIDRVTLGLALVVGVLFGLLFVALERPGDAGLWPVFFSRFTGLPTLAVAAVVMLRGQEPPPVRRTLLPGAVIGLLVAGGNVAYLVSTRRGDLSIVAVVVSMYPASTVLPASMLDGERPTSGQLMGMALAVAALLLITLGN
jgi:drug/metabolite transporter (DMT)-like permease